MLDSPPHRDPESQKKWQAKKKNGEGGKSLKNGCIQKFPTQTGFFAKTITLSSEINQEYRPECYCSDEEATET